MCKNVENLMLNQRVRAMRLRICRLWDIYQAAIEQFVLSLTPGRFGTNDRARFVLKLDEYPGIQYRRVSLGCLAFFG